MQERRLPNELLLLVKNCIPLWDLRTHVCYYHTCRTTAAFYGDEGEQAEFWRRSCCLAGLGWTAGDTSWKDIAFECIKQDGFCSHPQCGGALLDYNGAELLNFFNWLWQLTATFTYPAEQVADVMERHDWDPEDGPWDALLDPTNAPEWLDPDRPEPHAHRLFGFIRFEQPPHVTAYSLYVPLPEAQSEGYLSSGGVDGSQRVWLRNHPIATHSIATFPSMQRIRLEFLNDGSGLSDRPIERDSGLTIWDIHKEIRHQFCRFPSESWRALVAEIDLSFLFRLNVELTAAELVKQLECCFSDVVLEDGLVRVDALQRYTTLRGLWADAPCAGMHLSCCDAQGPVYCFNSLRA